MKLSIYFFLIALSVLVLNACHSSKDKNKAQLNSRFNNVVETIEFPSPDGKQNILQFTVDSLMTGLHGDIPFYIHSIKVVENNNDSTILLMKAQDYKAQNLKFVKWLTNNYALITDAGVFGIEAFFLYNRRLNEINTFKYNIGIEISRLELATDDHILIEVDGEKNIYHVETENVIITEEGRVDAKRKKKKKLEE